MSQVTKENFTVSAHANNWPDLSVVPGLDWDDAERLRPTGIISTKFLFKKYDECRQQYGINGNFESKFRIQLIKHGITPKNYVKAAKVCRAIAEWHENMEKSNPEIQPNIFTAIKQGRMFSQMTSFRSTRNQSNMARGRSATSPPDMDWPDLTIISGINEVDSAKLNSVGIYTPNKLYEKLDYFRSTKGCDFQRYFCQWYLDQLGMNAIRPSDFRYALTVCNALEESSIKSSNETPFFGSRPSPSVADSPDLLIVPGINDEDATHLIAAGIYTPRQLLQKLKDFLKFHGCDYRRYFCQWYLQQIGRGANYPSDFRYALNVCNELSEGSEKIPTKINLDDASYIKVAMNWPDLIIMQEINEEEGAKLYMTGIYTPKQLFDKLKDFRKSSKRDFRLFFCRWYLQQLQRFEPSPSDFRNALAVCDTLEDCERKLSASRWLSCFPVARHLPLVIDWPDLMVVYGINEEDGKKLIASGIYTPRHLINQVNILSTGLSSGCDKRKPFCEWYLETLGKNPRSQSNLRQALRVCIELEELDANKNTRPQLT